LRGMKVRWASDGHAAPHPRPDRRFDVVIGSDLIYYEADAAARGSMLPL